VLNEHNKVDQQRPNQLTLLPALQRGKEEQSAYKPLDSTDRIRTVDQLRRMVHDRLDLAFLLHMFDGNARKAAVDF
jgi:hypothetical protein